MALSFVNELDANALDEAQPSLVVLVIGRPLKMALVQLRTLKTATVLAPNDGSSELHRKATVLCARKEADLLGFVDPRGIL
jgi:hypothetical protein